MTTPVPRTRTEAPTEPELVTGLQRGEPDSLASLLDLHGESLMRYLLSLVLRRDEAEDIFQETWVRVLRQAHRADPARPFAPWLFRVARNLAFDHLRWRRRWRLLVGGEAPAEVGDPSGRPTTPEILASADLARRLLAGLGPKLREVVHLRFWGDCSYEEIAAIAGVPVGTVKSRLNRALAQMGRGLKRLEVSHASAEGL
ncbi:MAG: RNA polymerase sigma factor [Thermoanaerobaculaceae bacterium]|jgi:RNA polymerase sigma-70 factor (ECF subfamily)|nr:RNA polymerase sigma factor [Thermoanaerobaculaceae bacterium]